MTSSFTCADSEIGKGGIKLWDVDTGLDLLTFGKGKTAYSTLAFSPDGYRLVAGSGASYSAMPFGGSAEAEITVWDARPVQGKK